MNNVGNALLVMTSMLLFYAYGFHWLQLLVGIFGIATWLIPTAQKLQKQKLELEIELLKKQIGVKRK